MRDRSRHRGRRIENAQQCDRIVTTAWVTHLESPVCSAMQLDGAPTGPMSSSFQLFEERRPPTDHHLVIRDVLANTLLRRAGQRRIGRPLSIGCFIDGSDHCCAPRAATAKLLSVLSEHSDKSGTKG
jgi:hypothetical protein